MVGIHFIQRAAMAILLTTWTALSADAAVQTADATPIEGQTIAGERLDPSTCGPGTIESIASVIARDRAAPPPRLSDAHALGFRYGVWVVPSRRATTFPFSGEHNVVNKTGDTRMGIGFPDVVDVHGAYFAGQAAEGAWTTGIRVVGYLDDQEVASTNWFRDIGQEPKWFDMDLCGVDRIIISCEPVLEGAGWYGMDDLTFTFHRPHDRVPTVLDFEDLSYDTTLTGTPYAGLTWEWGMGFAISEPVHAPQIPPDIEAQRSHDDQDGGPLEPQDAGTLPDFEFDFGSVIRGDAGSSSYPPDTMGAVGPSHYVTVVNRNFAVYDKATGSELANIHLGSFLPGSNGDPRVLFDQHSQRWFVIASDFSANARIYLAVSFTSDPMGDWFKTYFQTNGGSDAGKWPDYPTLGVDANGLYTSAYMVGGTNRMTLFAIDKAPLIAPVPSLGAVTAFRELRWEGAIQPAHTYGTPAGEFCISVYGSSSLRLRRVNPPPASPTLTELGYVTIPYHSGPPDAPARGSSTPLDTVDNRLMMAVYRNGSLWTCHTVRVNNRAACRWYEIDTATGTLEQSGTVSDDTLYYFFPSIMVNQHGHAVMGFTGSCSSEYASAYYTGRRLTDPAGEMGLPVCYRVGVAAQNNIDGYGRNRWGDYSQTTLDPVDEMQCWTIQEYAHATNIWGTQAAVLSAPDPDGCYAPTVMAGGCRSLLVTPVSVTSHALLVTGDPGDPAVSCVSRYVQADGTLGADPVFLTGAEWEGVAIHGAELIPEASYRIQTECGSPGSRQLSGFATATTWKWGDVASPPNGVVNLDDVLLILSAFQDDFTNVTLERADLAPCTPDRVINVADILAGLAAFQGVSYADAGCPLPCP